MEAPLPLARHQLVWLHDAAWQHALVAATEAGARECIALWQARDWPLVVARQQVADRLSLGLPAPAAWARRRVAVSVPHAGVARFGAFPAMAALSPLLDGASRDGWARLGADLEALGCQARVYGGHGWQALTGLAYVHAASDIDLALPVANAAQADAVCRALNAASAGLPRLDGELLFADGAGIAWREWAQFRRGDVPQVLVKRLHGAALECPRLEATA